MLSYRISCSLRLSVVVTSSRSDLGPRLRLAIRWRCIGWERRHWVCADWGWTDNNDVIAGVEAKFAGPVSFDGWPGRLELEFDLVFTQNAFLAVFAF